MVKRKRKTLTSGTPREREVRALEQIARSLRPIARLSAYGLALVEQFVDGYVAAQKPGIAHATPEHCYVEENGCRTIRNCRCPCSNCRAAYPASAPL